jgi:hypothetical protein
MNAFNYFDKIYCINLEKDVQRKENMISLFTELDILDIIQFVSGVTHDDSNIGCNKSCVNMFLDAKSNNYEKILMFEDDIAPIGDVLLNLEKCINDIEPDWDMFYLGGIPHRVEWFKNDEVITSLEEYINKKHYIKYSDSLVKLNGGRITLKHAVAYKNTTFDIFINKFSTIEKIENRMMDDMDKWSCNYYQQQPNIKTFLACPMLFNQSYGYSNNIKTFVDMSNFNKDLYNLLLKMTPNN